MSRRIIRVVRRKAPVIERGPKEPTKQKVIVLRRVREGEAYVHKEEIPVSIGIPEYFAELRELELARKREAEQFANKTIIFLIGGPGSGKGTQSSKIIERFDTGYMSAGELLRAEAASGSEIGAFIGEQMKLGAILPQEIAISLLKKEIIRQDKALYLIDGFPRKVDHAVTFEETVCSAACALWLDVPDEVLVERLLERSKDSGREDDNPETIKLRIKTFHEISEAVFALFEETGRAVKIDGNREPDVVFAEVERLISRVLNHEPLFPVPAEEEEQPEPASE